LLQTKSKCWYDKINQDENLDIEPISTACQEAKVAYEIDIKDKPDLWGMVWNCGGRDKIFIRPSISKQSQAEKILHEYVHVLRIREDEKVALWQYSYNKLSDDEKKQITMKEEALAYHIELSVFGCEGGDAYQCTLNTLTNNKLYFDLEEKEARTLVPPLDTLETLAAACTEPSKKVTE
jgi:hypothetical protein